MTRIYILIIVLGILSAVGYGAFLYYKDTQTRIAVLTSNNAKLKTAHDQTVVEFDQYRKNVKEGFSLSDNDNDNSINECILRKIKALESELGNSDDHNKIKEILKNAKKACDYDATKCIINLIKKNTGPTSLNLDDMFNDKDKDCIHYKNCTELSKNLTTMIDNIGRR